jgi:hypothetical protein
VALATLGVVDTLYPVWTTRDEESGREMLARVLIVVLQGIRVESAIGAPPERERQIQALRALLARLLSKYARERLTRSPTLKGGRT